MKKLILSPQAGFGNRMRALCAAKVFGLLAGREVYHYWTEDLERSSIDHVNDMKGIDPSYIFDLGIPLFDGQEVDICFSEWTPGDYWHREQSTAQHALRCAQLIKLGDIAGILDCDADAILVETSLELRFPRYGEFREIMMMEIYKTYFSLNDRWSAICRSLPSFDNGIAIRRGNFLHYHTDADIPPTVIAEFIRRLDGSKVIFSDDFEFQTSLRELALAPSGIGESGSGLSTMDRYISQFITLYKCRRVLGTKGSSFAEQAALFGGKICEPI